MAHILLDRTNLALFEATIVTIPALVASGVSDLSRRIR